MTGIITGTMTGYPIFLCPNLQAFTLASNGSFVTCLKHLLHEEL